MSLNFLIFAHFVNINVSLKKVKVKIKLYFVINFCETKLFHYQHDDKMYKTQKM